MSVLSEQINPLLAARALPDGGFASSPAGAFQPEATAWACLALRSTSTADQLVNAGRRRLTGLQGEDGAVRLEREQPWAIWPTPLAILAWQGSRHQADAQARARDFLLTANGQHWSRPAGYPCAHDTAIPGWPWTTETHSWVEPTALALLALAVTGQSDHPRCHEGRRLLLDRQLPKGGWNYGNPVFYGDELPPQVHNTGLALAALANHAPRTAVAASLAYLHQELPRLQAPLSLAWGLLGLAAWEPPHPQASRWLRASLQLAARHGGYATTDLALLSLAANAPQGLLAVLP